MAPVKLENIAKRYGEATVIEGLNLAIAEREFVVLVGPSGCGKTTTLRMVAGLESVSAGRVRIGDRDVTDLRPGLRNCAMVFQSYALYPHMTAAENIAYGMKVRRVPKPEREAAVARAAGILGLGEMLGRKPRELSGGQRQRVAIGRAIVRDPDVFLFDEPLSNLDAKLRIEMRAELKELHRRLARTIVYVTHDQIEAMTLADRVVIMNAGRIEQAADPITLYERPANRFVAGFVGAPSMNFLPVEIIGAAARLADGATLPLRREGLRDGPAVLGLRPENTGVGAPPDAPTLTMSLRAIEPLGPHTLALGEIAGAQATAQLDAHARPEPGARVEIGVDMARAHFFDSGTGAAL